MTGESSPPEIHQKKREIVQDVDTGNLVVELDSVKQRRPSVEQNDVSQMQIAMALPDKAQRAAPLEHLRTPIELGPRVLGEARGCARLQTGSPELGQTGAVSVDDPCHARSAAVIRAMLGGQVEFGDRRRQEWHQLQAEAVCGGKTVEERVLREPVHLHQPVDGRAVATERKASVRFAVDRDEPAVEVRGSPPVQSQFRLTKRAAPFARGEIEIVEPDGSFELVPRAPARKTMEACVSIRSTATPACVDGAPRKSMTAV